MKTHSSLSAVWTLAGMMMLAMFASLGGGVFACMERRAEMAAEENGSACRDKLIEVANLNRSVRGLNGVMSEAAKHKLSLQLAAHLREVCSNLWNADYTLQTIGHRYCASILEQERAEPENYLTPADDLRAEEQQAWDTLREDSFILISPGRKSRLDASLSPLERGRRLGMESVGQLTREPARKDG